MRKTKLFITIVTTLTLSMAALTACTVAEASTHAATTEAIKTEAATTTAGETSHAPSNRLEDILQRGYNCICVDIADNVNNVIVSLDKTNYIALELDVVSVFNVNRR